MVKVRRDAAAATGHVHLQIFQSRQYNVKPKMVLKKVHRAIVTLITLECRSDRLFAVKDLS